MEYITDTCKMSFEKFFKKIFGEHYDLYVQSDTFFLDDGFENFKNTCLKIYELDTSKFLLAPGLALEIALKKSKEKLDLLIDFDMLLMTEKGIKWGICHSIYRYAKANNNYMKDYDENKESSYGM